MIEHKVLPFTLADGTEVRGHAILNYANVRSVVFSVFDQEAEMPIEILVHVGDWTKFSKKARGRAHSIRAVILADGSRIHCTTYSLRYNDNEAYLSAPIMARDVYRIARLGDRTTMLEVAGVQEWAYSDRKDDSMIIDPWARDNAAFRERFPKLAAMN
ncbi:hypothetical protein D3C87_324730 [compost metagenome]